MPFAIVRDDITHVKADAIVNAANEQLRRGGGVCGAIFEAAGERRLQRACDKIGHCPTGSAVVTPAYGLKARYVIHAVGPIWQGGFSGERKLLASCYRTALKLAHERKCRSIAFPLISAGIYGYPQREALQVAQGEIRAFLERHDMTVTLVLYDTDVMQIADTLRLRVESYIDDVYVGARKERFARQRWEQGFDSTTHETMAAPTSASKASDTYEMSAAASDVEDSLPSWGGAFERDASAWDVAATRPEEPDLTYCPTCGAPVEKGFRFCMRCGAALGNVERPYPAESVPRPSPAYGMGSAAPSPARREQAPTLPRTSAPAPRAAARPSIDLPRPLRNLLEHLDAGFSETLLTMIDERGLRDAQVYKRANLTRQHFSKIRSNPRYRPTKTTVLALAVALELSLDETSLLLERAGFALSHADQRDVIVEFFIREGNYDIFEINNTLFAFDQPLLG